MLSRRPDEDWKSVFGFGGAAIFGATLAVVAAERAAGATAPDESLGTELATTAGAGVVPGTTDVAAGRKGPVVGEDPAVALTVFALKAGAAAAGPAHLVARRAVEAALALAAGGVLETAAIAAGAGIGAALLAAARLVLWALSRRHRPAR